MILYNLFFEVLKIRKWLTFSFFCIFTNGSAKSSGTVMGSLFFEGLNITNDQNPLIRGIYVP